MEERCKGKLSAELLEWPRNPLAEEAAEGRTRWLPSTRAWQCDDPPTVGRSEETTCSEAELLPWEVEEAEWARLADRDQWVEARQALAGSGMES